uniref:Uncharacterized protein n=1 Tax=Octopus bimaculoides TaxID=37653 RepID=A0A0L8GK92_OCTBM
MKTLNHSIRSGMVAVGAYQKREIGQGVYLRGTVGGIAGKCCHEFGA